MWSVSSFTVHRKLILCALVVTKRPFLSNKPSSENQRAKSKFLKKTFKKCKKSTNPIMNAPTKPKMTINPSKNPPDQSKKTKSDASNAVKKSASSKPTNANVATFFALNITSHFNTNAILIGKLSTKKGLGRKTMCKCTRGKCRRNADPLTSYYYLTMSVYDFFIRVFF